MNRQAAKHSFLFSCRNQDSSSSASSVSLDSEAYCMASCRARGSTHRVRKSATHLLTLTWALKRKGHLIKLVLLAELYALFPAVVALKQVGSDSPELNQLVLLQALGQWDVVKVIVGIYWCSQCLAGVRRKWKREVGIFEITEDWTKSTVTHLIVLLCDEEVVKCFVDRFVVVVLYWP